MTTRRAAGRLVSGLAALLTLAALTAGLPLALWTLGAQFLPHHLPTLTDIGTTLGQRDDGTVFLGLLVAIGFLAWACFTVSVLLELAARVRHRPVRPVPGLGWSRLLASALLTAIALGATGTSLGAAGPVPLSGMLDAAPLSPPAATASVTLAAFHTPLAPATSHHHHDHDDEHGDDRAAQRDYNERGNARDHRYSRDDYDQVNEHSGDAEHSHARHPTGTHRPGHDTNRAHDSHHRAQRHHGRPARHAPAIGHGYQVRPGDSLWRIAEQHLGDPERWRDLYGANHGRLQADGGALTDPAYIRPGWILALPASAGPHTNGHTAPAPRHTPPAPLKTPAPAPAPAPTQTPGEIPPSHAPTDAAPAAPGQPAGPASFTDPADPQPTSHPIPQVSPNPPPVPTAEHRTLDRTEPTGITTSVLTGIGALAAAGLIATLVALRFRASRRRRPGMRMLGASTRGPAETALLTVEDPDAVDRLDTALRHLADTCNTEHLTPPLLHGATISGSHITLHLAEPADPISPWRTDTTTDDQWHLPANTPLPDTNRITNTPAPYPALATLGRSHDALVLLDLETAGAITLTGDPDRIVAVLTALAVELAVSGWADHLHVTTVGFGVRLAETLPDRLHYAPDIDTALDHADTRAGHTHDALTRDGATSTLDARARGVAEDSWIPHIILTADPVTHAQQQRIRDIVATEPSSSIGAVIAAGDNEHRLPGPWHIDVPDDPTEPITLAAFGDLPLVLQHCDQLAYQNVLDELAAAADTTQTPADYGPLPDELDELPDLDDTHSDDHEDDLAGLDEDLAGEPELDEHHDAGDVHELHLIAAEVISTAPTQPHEGPLDVGITDALNPTPPRTGRLTPVPDLPADDDHSPTDNDETAAAETSADDGEPQLRILGPVDITGVDPNAVAASKRARLLELAAYLALFPGRSGEDVSEALGGRAPWAPPTRQSNMSRLRGWLGDNPAGHPYVQPVGDRSGYRLSETMRCDWTRAQQLIHRGFDRGPDGITLLEQALQLVRGRPFADAPVGRYTWADLIRHEIVALITDAAHVVANAHLADQNPRAARAALKRGLSAEPTSELLYRDLARVEYQARNIAGIHTIAEHIQRVSDDLGIDPEPETTDLLRELLDPAHRRGDALAPPR